MNDPDQDKRHMAHALRLGARGLGLVAPWPSVGCVIVQNGHIVGRGTSDKTSLRHAEVVALTQAGTAARSATAYVTLEPCCHQGRTPPCTNALIDAGIARVVTTIEDPNPIVAGRGLAALRAAGVEVTTGVLASAAEAQQRGFLNTIRLQRPMVTLKLASTLDGRIATATGESQWITGQQARRSVHAMRLSHDAVLIGGGTARADDPTLTARNLGASHQPTRIVASRRLNLPFPSRLTETIDEAPLWLIHGAEDVDEADTDRWQNAGAKLLPAEVSNGQLDPQNMLQKLAQEGLTRVFCEGGGTLAASLLNAGVVDELIWMSAGIALGAEGQPAIGALGVSKLAEAERFKLIETRPLGADILHRWARI
ncbi:MAG: bifunctional diaminohydroxyphosphoribosylaminopyrimidine deaminase/5-amino-6-(5-phosphoribosylamino)uracil reductase RibD [Pseudomonadota bacterium]